MTHNEPVRAMHRNHLKTLIEHAIKNNDVHCDLNHIDISAIDDMSGLFEFSSFNGDISRWNVSHVKNMANMFKASLFNGDISKWDVSNVQTMDQMFRASYFNSDISHWNTAKVTNMCEMFKSSQFNGDLSKWSVRSVRDMHNMFEGAAFNGDVSYWDVSQTLDMENMFQHSNFNGNVLDWQLNPNAMLNGLFKSCPFQGDFPHLDVSRWSGASLVEPSYRGRFNNQYDLYDAENIFGNGKALNSYIRDTASGQLDRLHFEKLLYLKSKPPWIAKDVYQWVKKQQPVLDGLGMESSEAGLWLQENFALKQDAEQSYPLDALQLDVLCP